MKKYLKIFVASIYMLNLSIEPFGVLDAASRPSNTALTDVRAEGEKIVLDLSQLMPYDIFTLSSPWRLVVEIPETVYRAKFSRKKVNNTLVKRIRGYQFKENPLITRVVLDLKAPVNYSAAASDSQVIISLKKDEVTARKASEGPKKKNDKAISSAVSSKRKKDLLDSLPREVVSLDFEGADIRDVIRLMSETSNINMIFGPEVGGNISVHLKRVPFNEAFQTILNLKGLVAAQLGSNILRITTPDNLQQDKTKAVVYTKIVPVNYLEAEEVKTHILAVMASSGRKGNITVVKESNSLVITDSQEGLAQAQRLIQRLDQKPKQVLVESRIVEINLNNGFDIGVQWEYGFQDLNLTPSGTLDDFNFVGLLDTDGAGRISRSVQGTDTGAIGPPTGTGVNLPGPTAAGITFGFIKNDQVISATLAALVTKSKARILSSPKVVTINGEEAKIEAVQDIPFRTSTVSGTGVVSNSFQNVSAGIILSVKPTINAADRITLEIKPESSFPTQDSTEAGPIIRTRSAETTVIIKDGETLVIGGLIDDQDTKGVNKVPILGDIPIIGTFFRNQTSRKIRNELLVFVTPRIIKD